MNNFLSPGLLALGLMGTLARPAVAQQTVTPLYSVPENEPHAVVRLRIGAVLPESGKGGWLVKLDSAGPARVAIWHAVAEITLRVAPGPHVLRFGQYREQENPEPHHLAAASPVNISAIFEEGGDYAVELAASKLYRLNCTCFAAYRVNGGDVVRSFLVTDEWAHGPYDRSFPSLPPPSTGARRGIAKKLHIPEQNLPDDWQDSRGARSVEGTWHDGSWELQLYHDGSAELGFHDDGKVFKRVRFADWRQHGDRILVFSDDYGIVTLAFLTLEGGTLVGSETVHHPDDDTVTANGARRFTPGPQPGGAPDYGRPPRR